MMKYKKINDEVFYFRARAVTLSPEDIAFLKDAAARNARKRARLCAHSSPDDKVHEMFIVHCRDAYIRPHKHLDRVESFQVLEGEADIILYNDNGNVSRVIALGDKDSGKEFYLRLSEPVFHTLLIRSEILLFKEVTPGPFHREGTVFAPWSPEENDTAGVLAFMKKFRGRNS